VGKGGEWRKRRVRVGEGERGRIGKIFPLPSSFFLLPSSFNIC
jgi:hypothetical protein